MKTNVTFGIVDLGKIQINLTDAGVNNVTLCGIVVTVNATNHEIMLFGIIEVLTKFNYIFFLQRSVKKSFKESIKAFNLHVYSH